MSCPPGPSSPFGFDFSDISNYQSFMDSLISFMNESAQAIQQVKKRSGLSSECLSPVRMTEEEKQQKMTDIIANLSQKYVAEASTLNSTDPSAYQTAIEPSEYETAHNTAFLMPDTETDCTCPPDSPPSRQSPRGRRAETPRNSPPRGRVATPDQYFEPQHYSTMIERSGCPLNSSGSSRGSPRRVRTPQSPQSPYSPMVDSGGLPYAYQSGSPIFGNTTSQSGRNLNSYSNMTSSGGYSGGECPRECTGGGSVNSTGRQQYRTLKGQQCNKWDYKQENRTV